MKKFNFGKIFALMAAGAAVFALVFAGCEQVNGVIRNALEQPKTAEAAGADELTSAFADPSVKVIAIQGDIKAETLSLTVAAGDKTISIPGGKETAIGSMELSAGSHVKLTNSSGGTSKSVGGLAAAAYSEQTYDGWATLVIWNNFKIPEGATFDLAGEVRLVFRVAEVEGTLKAEIEDSILGAGGEAPVITGGGNVQTSKDAEAKTPELAAADIKKSEEHKALPPVLVPEPIAITSAAAGIMDKGGKRQFSANRAVTWTVEGGETKNLYNVDEDTKSVNTTISDTGLLTIAADETNITLTVRATSGEETKTETVKVKGWKQIESVQKIFGTNVIYGISYGAGKWVAVGGKTGYSTIAYSTDGEAWTEVTGLSPGNVLINSVVYDGPDGDKKFFALGGSVVYYSTDGEVWTSVTVSTGDTAFKFNGAAYGNAMYIAVETSSTKNKMFGVATSTDGISWIWIGIPDAVDSLKSVAMGGNQITFHDGNFIVAFGLNACIAKTTNGTNMELVANTAISNTVIEAKGYSGNVPEYTQLTAAIFAGNQWIVAGNNETLMFSSDTTTWTPIVVGEIDSVVGIGFSIAYGGGKLVIGENFYNSSFSSEVAILSTSLPLSASPTWTITKLNEKTTWTGNSGDGAGLDAIGYGDNKFIVTGSSGRLAVAHEETLD
jgi:hypothetical protein